MQAPPITVNNTVLQQAGPNPVIQPLPLGRTVETAVPSTVAQELQQYPPPFVPSLDSPDPAEGDDEREVFDEKEAAFHRFDGKTEGTLSDRSRVFRRRPTEL
jgi:hypothetical protein